MRVVVALVGHLPLQTGADPTIAPHPLDVLGAETEGMIGYMIEQELAAILTMVEVDPADPAFNDPRKPIGPGDPQEEARRLAAEMGWTLKPDGALWRRVVPSPRPQRIFEIRAVKWLLEKGAIVICAGGGGIPTMYEPGTRVLVGAEVVIDKDRASGLLAAGGRAAIGALADVEGMVEGTAGNQAVG